MLRRSGLRQAELPENTQKHIDLDNASCAQLLDAYNTEHIKTTKRMTRVNTARAHKNKRKAKHRWTLSVEEEYCRCLRELSNQILTKHTRKRTCMEMNNLTRHIQPSSRYGLAGDLYRSGAAC